MYESTGGHISIMSMKRNSLMKNGEIALRKKWVKQSTGRNTDLPKDIVHSLS